MSAKLNAPRNLALLLLLQSASLVGLLSLHRFPHIVRVVGKDIHSTVTNLTEAASLIIAISLALTARGLIYRRRRAWIIAVSLQVALIGIGVAHNLHRYINHHHTSHIVFGAFGISHLLSELIILAILLMWRGKFTTKSGSHTRSSDLYYFIRVSLLTYIVGVIVVFLDSRHFVDRPSFIQIFEITFKGLFGISGPVALSALKYQDRLETILFIFGSFIAGSTIVNLLRPIAKKSIQSPEARIALSDLMVRYPSDDSLGYFALRDDKSLMWSDNRKAAIAYSVKNGVMIASGDPLGDKECWPSVIANFLKEADKFAWIPAIYGCTEEAGEIWHRETGFEALELGDEAIVDVADYNLESPHLKKVRQTINRARREENVAFASRISDLPIEKLERFAELAQLWRRGGDERGFSMALGRFCSPEDRDALIVWAEKDGKCVALLQFAPWGRDGLSLDLMRRAFDSSPGVNELLIDRAVQYARENSVRRISLNFATFRSIFERGERLGAGPITRFNHRILKFASRFVQMESLYRFNSKFAPIWEPRFLLFPSVGKLVRISIAVLQIESFLPDSLSSLVKRKAKP
jgi:lysyl-tRNA synthetase class 2